MPINIQFKLTFDDYLRAQRLHSKRTWGRRVWYIVSRTLIPVLGLLYVLIFVLIFWRTTPVGWLLVALPCGMYFAFYPVVVRLRLNRCYRRTRTGDEENSVGIGEEGIRIRAENPSNDLNWKAVQSCREDQNVFVLYLAPAKFIVFPKRVFSEEQILELQSLLARQVRSAT